MRAMVLERPGPAGPSALRLTELPAPVPGPGEVRLRVEACGVCRTDLHIAEGDLVPGKPALVPGHQVVGRIDGAGAGLENRVGRRAGATWMFSVCGECGFCREGRENLCERARFTGLDADGGYAEWMIVPSAFAFDLPEDVPAAACAPWLCAGAIGYRSLKLSGIKPGGTLGLFGFGASAHLALQVAVRWGCRVHVYTRGEAHRTRALELGAAWAGGLEDPDPGPVHAAVTFAPSGAVAAAALARLRRGGTVAVNAVHMDPLPSLEFPLLYHERVLRTVANVTRDDVRGFLALAVRGGLRAEIRTFPLEEANEALAGIRASSFTGSAVLDLRAAP